MNPLRKTFEQFVQLVPSGKSAVYGLTNEGRIFRAEQRGKGQTAWTLLPLPDFANWPPQPPCKPWTWKS